MLLSCNKWNGKHIRTIDAQLQAPFDLLIDHPHAQPACKDKYYLSQCFACIQKELKVGVKIFPLFGSKDSVYKVCYHEIGELRLNFSPKKFEN